MIGIADPKLWNLGVGLLSKWNGLTFSFDFLFIVNMATGGHFTSLHKVCPARISIFFCFTPRNSSSARLGQNSRASTSSSSIEKTPSYMFARGNCGLSGESMTASKMHLLVLVHLRILNWLVVNSPRLCNKGLSWTYLHRGIDGDSQISQNRMRYDEIECNRNKDRGNGLPTLNGQSEPFHSELKNSE